ncbi:TPA: hypothetical protein NQG77_000248 [Salmonella enterica subsp. enterica serovar Infantis]|nr:hypothetical protein [Salmonella enterica subsp. enterica serovar Infantis]
MKTKTKNSFNWLTDKDKQARDKAKRQAIHAAMQKHEKAHQEYIHSPEHLEAVAAYRQEQAQEAHEAIYKLEGGKRIADALKAATMARVASGELSMTNYVRSYKPLSQMGFEWQMKKQLKDLLRGTSRNITLKGVNASAVSWSWTSSNSSYVSLSGQTDTNTQSSITAIANATGNSTLSCVMTDVDGTTYRGSLNVAVSAAPVEKGTIIPANCSFTAPTSFSCPNGTSVDYTNGCMIELDLDEEDDGTYTYQWYCNGNGSGVGTLATQDGTGAGFSGTSKTGTQYSKVVVTGTSKGTGPILWSCIVTDKAGNVYKTPSNAVPSGGSSANCNTISVVI